MNLILKLVVIIFLCGSVASCKWGGSLFQDEELLVSNLKEADIGDSIPEAVAEQVIQELKEEEKAKLNPRNLRGFVKRGVYHVYIRAEQKNLLGGKGRKIIADRGVGVLDLKEVLADRASGEAKILFEFPQPEIEKIQLFYRSDFSPKSAQSKNPNFGCGAFVDLTSLVSEFISGDGAAMVLDKGSYISVYAGIYYFFVFAKGGLYLSRLQITDSRYSSQLCAG
jgi:hypothetical protein